jgi:ComF family protein
MLLGTVFTRAAVQKRFSPWLSMVGDALISTLFPADCLICDHLLTRGTRLPICDPCLASFVRMPATLCDICGSAIDPPFASSAEPLPSLNAAAAPPPTCHFCKNRKYNFDRARSFAIYEAQIVPAVLLLKFERIGPLGAWFAQRLGELVRHEGSLLQADIVVPVPLHSIRQRERGYNQAELIAKPLAKLLGLPCRPVLLTRTRPRPDKRILSSAERWDSVRGAFATRSGSQVDNLRVLLLDDVLTTGATLDACAQVLRGAGAKTVIGLTVARAAHPPLIGSPES